MSIQEMKLTWRVEFAFLLADFISKLALIKSLENYQICYQYWHSSSVIVVNRKVHQHIRLTSQICSSVYSSSGSRLLLTVPSNMVGSCGIMLSLDLRSCTPIEHMLMPSIMIQPPTGSIILKRVCMRVDFPLPVLPTIPFFIPPANVHEMPLKTSGICAAYRTCV